MFGRLMPREGRFFELFNELAEQVLLGSRELSALLDSFSDLERRVFAIETIEKQGDKVTHPSTPSCGRRSSTSSPSCSSACTLPAPSARA